MYSNECVTIHRIYQRFKSSAVPLILVFIGLSVFHFILRRYVTDVGTFWCDTDLMAAVIIIGIIELFEGLLHENQLLYGKLTEKTEIIQQKNLNILKGCNLRMRNNQLSVQDVEERLSKSFSAELKCSKSLKSNEENKKLLKENEQLQNQILNKGEIFQQQKIALNQLKTANELLEEKVQIQNEEIQQFQSQLLIKDEKIQKREKSIKDFEKLFKETQKQLSKKCMNILEMNVKIKELENEISKLKNDQKATNQIPIKSEIVCKKCQKQNVQHQELELIQPENAKIINNMLSPSREKLISSPQSKPWESDDDDDLPAPPPSIAAKFLAQTSSTSIFSSSTPTIHATSESTMKSIPPPIAPKPKHITCSPSISSPPPPPPPLPPSFNKSLSATPSSSSSSSNVTPKRTPQNFQRILSPDLQDEIRSPPKLKNSDEAEKEREIRKSKTQIIKRNETADFKTILSQRANKVNANTSDDEKENDSEWDD